MEAGTDDSQRQDLQPDLLFLGLRCAVCLDFYEKPHTLNCGHTFCLRCLRTLAKMSRGSGSRPPLDRLRFRCPSCRKMTVARPLLRRHASVNIALRDVVDAWINSPYSVGRLETISLRSIASQTENTIDKSDILGDIQSDDDDMDSIISIDTEGIHSDHQLVTKCTEAAVTQDLNNDDIVKGAVDDEEEEEDGDKGSGQNTPTETLVDDGISREETRRVTVHRFPAKTATTKKDTNSEVVSSSMRKRRNRPEDEETPPDANDVIPSDVTFETSSSDDDLEVEVVPFLADIHIVQDPPRRSVFAIRSFVTLIKLLLTEIRAVLAGIWSSNCRLGLTLFWFAYGGLIVCLSRSFFPWMVLYTLVYFLIMYAEMARPFMMGY